MEVVMVEAMEVVMVEAMEVVVHHHILSLYQHSNLHTKGNKHKQGRALEGRGNNTAI